MVNTVAVYSDGSGNRVNAIQWDGDTVDTWANIHAWTKRTNLNARSVLAIQTPKLNMNVGITDWLVMDSNREPQVFSMTNPQFQATYVASTP